MSVKSYKILIIDDSVDALAELQTLLTTAGFIVESEVNGVDGMRHFLRDPAIRVFLADIRMPECDGVRLLDQIRNAGERGLDATVILMTGQPDVHTTVDALNLGASAMLMKPLDPIELVSVISKAVSIQSEILKASADTNQGP
jgi:two-component system response regulator HydG